MTAATAPPVDPGFSSVPASPVPDDLSVAASTSPALDAHVAKSAGNPVGDVHDANVAAAAAMTSENNTSHATLLAGATASLAAHHAQVQQQQQQHRSNPPMLRGGSGLGSAFQRAGALPFSGNDPTMMRSRDLFGMARGNSGSAMASGAGGLGSSIIGGNAGNGVGGGGGGSGGVGGPAEFLSQPVSPKLNAGAMAGMLYSLPVSRRNSNEFNPSMLQNDMEHLRLLDIEAGTTMSSGSIANSGGGGGLLGSTLAHAAASNPPGVATASGLRRPLLHQTASHNVTNPRAFFSQAATPHYTATPPMSILDQQPMASTHLSHQPSLQSSGHQQGLLDIDNPLTISDFLRMGLKLEDLGMAGKSTSATQDTSSLHGHQHPTLSGWSDATASNPLLDGLRRGGVPPSAATPPHGTLSGMDYASLGQMQLNPMRALSAMSSPTIGPQSTLAAGSGAAGGIRLRQSLLGNAAAGGGNSAAVAGSIAGTAVGSISSASNNVLASGSTGNLGLGDEMSFGPSAIGLQNAAMRGIHRNLTTTALHSMTLAGLSNQSSTGGTSASVAAATAQTGLAANTPSTINSATAAAVAAAALNQSTSYPELLNLVDLPRGIGASGGVSAATPTSIITARVPTLSGLIPNSSIMIGAGNIASGAPSNFTSAVPSPTMAEFGNDIKQQLQMFSPSNQHNQQSLLNAVGNSPSGGISSHGQIDSGLGMHANRSLSSLLSTLQATAEPSVWSPSATLSGSSQQNLTTIGVSSGGVSVLKHMHQQHHQHQQHQPTLQTPQPQYAHPAAALRHALNSSNSSNNSNSNNSNSGNSNNTASSNESAFKVYPASGGSRGNNSGNTGGGYSSTAAAAAAAAAAASTVGGGSHTGGNRGSGGGGQRGNRDGSDSRMSARGAGSNSNIGREGRDSGGSSNRRQGGNSASGARRGANSTAAVALSNSDESGGGGRDKYQDVPLSELIGEIGQMCRDQHGCRYLQRKVEERDDAQTAIIFNQVLPIIGSLSTDSFGNYLCQKLIENCSDNQRTDIAIALRPHLASISQNMHGTRVAQRLVENISGNEQIQAVIDALDGHVTTLIKDLNGNHVVQKCLARMTSEQCMFIHSSVARSCVSVATHRHGCCVFQRCIDHASVEQRSMLVERVTEMATELVEDAFGNYVIQYILELEKPQYSDPLIERFVESTVSLSTQKFSSNVIEKCIRVANPSTRAAMIEQLRNSDILDKLLRDAYANYVIQTAIDFSDNTQRNLLIETIRPHLPSIRSTPYGRRIQNKIARVDGQRSHQHSANPSRSGSPVQHHLHHGGIPSNHPANALAPPSAAAAGAAVSSLGGPPTATGSASLQLSQQLAQLAAAQQRQQTQLHSLHEQQQTAAAPRSVLSLAPSTQSTSAHSAAAAAAATAMASAQSHYAEVYAQTLAALQRQQHQ